MLPEFPDGEFVFVESVTPFIVCSVKSLVSGSEVEPFPNLGGRSLGGFLLGVEAVAAPFMVGMIILHWLMAKNTVKSCIKDGIARF